jgi:hypothetical protein
MNTEGGPKLSVPANSGLHGKPRGILPCGVDPKANGEAPASGYGWRCSAGMRAKPKAAGDGAVPPTASR